MIILSDIEFCPITYKNNITKLLHYLDMLTISKSNNFKIELRN